MKRAVIELAMFALVVAAGVSHAGWLTGLAAGAAVYLLMPWQPRA